MVDLDKPPSATLSHTGTPHESDPEDGGGRGGANAHLTDTKRMIRAIMSREGLHRGGSSPASALGGITPQCVRM